MPQPCTVLIASADLLPALRARAGAVGEVVTFTDTDALRALEEITRRRPDAVTLEQLFATSPRGQALIHRITVDPTLTGTEIRVLSHSNEPPRVAPRTMGDGGTSAAVATAPAVATTPGLPGTLDQRGTRRAPRYQLAAGVEAMVDGNIVTVIDLSTCGAQVVSAGVLKPNQRVRLAFNDDRGSVRVSASVAWASFEIPPRSAPRYRAGLEFIDADPAPIDAYCARHKA